jgi:hypothetical protein
VTTELDEKTLSDAVAAFKDERRRWGVEIMRGPRNELRYTITRLDNSGFPQSLHVMSDGPQTANATRDELAFKAAIKAAISVALKLPSPKIKFREHRGRLHDSLATCIEIGGRAELLSNINNILAPFFDKSFPDSALRIAPYIPVEHNTGWEYVHIVTLDGYGLIGFTEGMPA